MTDSIEILHVAGVRSAELMGEICPEADDVPFLQMRELSVLGIDALVFRISFTGEAGFELHVSADDAAKLWRRIWAHPAASELGLAPFGGQAVNALRIEKAFRVKSDLDFAHWTEAGIEPFVALNRKNELMRFLGRDTTPQGSGTAADATLADDDASAAMPIPTRKHAVFTVKTNPAHAWSVPGDAPVLDSNGSVVGFTTTSAKGAVSAHRRPRLRQVRRRWRAVGLPRRCRPRRRVLRPPLASGTARAAARCGGRQAGAKAGGGRRICVSRCEL